MNKSQEIMELYAGVLPALIDTQWSKNLVNLYNQFHGRPSEKIVEGLTEEERAFVERAKAKAYHKALKQAERNKWPPAKQKQFAMQAAKVAEREAADYVSRIKASAEAGADRQHEGMTSYANVNKNQFADRDAQAMGGEVGYAQNLRRRGERDGLEYAKQSMKDNLKNARDFDSDTNRNGWTGRGWRRLRTKNEDALEDFWRHYDKTSRNYDKRYNASRAEITNHALTKVLDKVGASNALPPNVRFRAQEGMTVAQELLEDYRRAGFGVDERSSNCGRSSLVGARELQSFSNVPPEFAKRLHRRGNKPKAPALCGLVGYAARHRQWAKEDPTVKHAPTSDEVRRMVKQNYEARDSNNRSYAQQLLEDYRRAGFGADVGVSEAGCGWDRIPCLVKGRTRQKPIDYGVSRYQRLLPPDVINGKRLTKRDKAAYAQPDANCNLYEASNISKLAGTDRAGKDASRRFGHIFSDKTATTGEKEDAINTELSDWDYDFEKKPSHLKRATFYTGHGYDDDFDNEGRFGGHSPNAMNRAAAAKAEYTRNGRDKLAQRAQDVAKGKKLKAFKVYKSNAKQLDMAAEGRADESVHGDWDDKNAQDGYRELVRANQRPDSDAKKLIKAGIAQNIRNANFGGVDRRIHTRSYNLPDREKLGKKIIWHPGGLGGGKFGVNYPGKYREGFVDERGSGSRLRRTKRRIGYLQHDLNRDFYGDIGHTEKDVQDSVQYMEPKDTKKVLRDMRQGIAKKFTGGDIRKVPTQDKHRLEQTNEGMAGDVNKTRNPDRFRLIAKNKAVKSIMLSRAEAEAIAAKRRQRRGSDSGYLPYSGSHDPLKEKEARKRAGVGTDEGWPLAALAAGSIALGGAGCSSAPNNSQTTAQTDSTQTDSDSEARYDSEGCHPVGNKTRAGDLIDCASERWQKHKPNFGGSNSGNGLGIRPKTAKNIEDAAKRRGKP